MVPPLEAGANPNARAKPDLNPKLSLGVDIGGTFTDIVAYDHRAKQQFSLKVLTTHNDPSSAVALGFERLVKENQLHGEDFTRVVHATTLFTNALIERRGAKTALITTAGFSDSLAIGRERKYELYDISIRKPEALVTRDMRIDVDERVLADGSIRTPLDTDQLVQAVRDLKARGVESIAVVFLHAYLNAVHERLAVEGIEREFDGLSVSASCDIAPEIREFERASTTVANAYVKPLAANYLDALANQLHSAGVDAELSLMMSSGGLTHLEEAKRVPVRLLESGPAAGALAAAFFGSGDASGRLLAFDMGGTTAKLSLIDDGEPLTAHAFEAARQKRFIEHSGLPIRISTIELIEIGAGGGSIADLDALGLLKVGPRSAGSEPGPAAYGRGGDQATVTDADFLLGYLNPDYFAGGTMSIDRDMAAAVIDTLAERAGLQRAALAFGIHDVVNENMASAARVHIAERGRDPANYTLLCTGGAGPVHAYYLALKLGIKRILCPPAAGVASAAGLLVAPARSDVVSSVDFLLPEAPLDSLEAIFVALETQAQETLEGAAVSIANVRVERSVDARFKGQGFELVVPLPAGPYDEKHRPNIRSELTEAYNETYREKYARTPPPLPIEFVNARVSLRVEIEGSTLEFGAPEAGEEVVVGQREAWFAEARGYVNAAVYRRRDLRPPAKYRGPAIIEDDGSTLIVGPRGSFEVLQSGNILVVLDD